MILEVLIVKGGAAIASYVAHHAAMAKVATVAYKVYKTYSLAQLGAAALGACVVVGGVKWCAESIDLLKKGAMAIDEGRKMDAIGYFGRLAYRLNGGVSTLPDSAHSALLQLHVPESKASMVANWIRQREVDIAKYASKH